MVKHARFARPGLPAASRGNGRDAVAARAQPAPSDEAVEAHRGRTRLPHARERPSMSEARAAPDATGLRPARDAAPAATVSDPHAVDAQAQARRLAQPSAHPCPAALREALRCHR
jgi:hypothetical protein